MFFTYVKGMGEWRFRKTRSGQWAGRITSKDWKYRFHTMPREEQVEEVPDSIRREEVITAANTYLNARHGLHEDHFEKQGS